jgi:beta-RFAP synthase
MVEQPGLELLAVPAPDWSAEGPLAERALQFARLVATGIQAEVPAGVGTPLQFGVLHAAPEHAGLGTGTQLGLAVAQAVCTAWGLQTDADQLARWSGRGLRSALGVYGFAAGGFLVEAGQRTSARGDALSPLVARVAFPEDWRIVLVLPEHAPGLHGPPEQHAFLQLEQQESLLAQTDALCRLLLLGLLPALAEGDLAAFGVALSDFNYRAGELFAAVQGGPYASPLVAGLVAYLRGHGAGGAGQSSWGPTVFGVVADQQEGEWLAKRLRGQFAPLELRTWVTPARNSGAE